MRKLLPPTECEIVLFNRENHMVFHPLLAEVAGAAIEPKDVAAPLRQLLRNVQCRTEEVMNLDLDNNIIEYEAHDGNRRQMNYDQLVIACGNTVNLGIIPGMDEHAFALKSIGDALALQAHVMEQLEKAEVCDDLEKRRWYLSFIIVGGGFSGVEVAGEINDLVRRSRKFFQNIGRHDTRVWLVHARDQILPEVSPSLREFARAEMERDGVRIRLNATAAYATPSGVALQDGKFISGATVVCTIGTSPLPFIERLNVVKDRARLVTEADMSLPGHPDAWAIGDCAAIVNASDGSLCPTVGQFAERQGAQVAKNIAARLKNEPTRPFSYKMMGSLCSIGGHNAVAEMLGLRLSGFLAWFLWRGVYLMKLPSLAQQIKVGIQWACDLIFPRTLAHVKADRSRRVCRAFYAQGDYIFKEGDSATDFYVIEQGEVEILRNHEGNGGSEIVA
ncbi:MAG: FAD-dependent oxidoreductase, partial [Acidobacteriales bacterium]|nr:FAD-dependent oxidoreductase [Terriglobales bacterium]